MERSPLESFDLSRDDDITVMRMQWLAPTLKAQDWDRADQLLRQILAARPDRMREILQRIDVAIMAGRMKDARALYDGLPVDFTQDRAEATAEFSQSALRLALRFGDVQVAAGIAARFAPGFAEDPLMALFAMRAFDRTGQTDAACAAAQVAGRLNADRPERLLEALRMLNNKGAVDAALDVAAAANVTGGTDAEIKLEVARALLKDATQIGLAMMLLQQVVAERPDHTRAHVLLMRAHGKTGDGAAALRLARKVAQLSDGAPGVLAEALQVMTGQGHAKEATGLLAQVDLDSCQDVDLLLQAGRTLIHSSDTAPQVATLLARALDLRPEDDRVRRQLARAYLRLDQPKRALEILDYEAARFADAPEPAHALAAEILMANNRFLDAVSLLQKLVADNPGHSGWKRACVSGLLLSGDTAGAEALYAADLAARPRNPRAYPDFVTALDDLDRQVDSARVPYARYEWAWQRLTALNVAPPDRAAWERRATWVHLADHLTLDWIEARPEDSGQIMDLMDGFEEANEVLHYHLSKGMGLFLASAHIGALFSSPLALAHTGADFRWVASTPVVANVPGAANLISTYAKSRLRLAKEIYRAVRAGCVVSLAADGKNAVTTPFAGDEIHLSDFVPRTIHQLGTPCLFPKFSWVDRRISVEVIEMVAPQPSDSLEDFVEAWQADYARILTYCFQNNPDNMRLTGGFWDSVSL